MPHSPKLGVENLTMELFNRLFTTKRKLDNANCESRDHGRSCKLNPEQVRLLLYKECDWRGRKLLFDSTTIDKVPAGKDDKPTAKQTGVTPCIVEVTEGYSYVYKGSTADAATLGEMIFGAVAMNHKGVSLKIHIMNEPKRLMCTKVFFVPSSRRISRVDRKASSVDQTEVPEGHQSKALNVPSKDDLGFSFSFDRGDSGFYGEHSLHSSVSSTCDFFSMFDVWDGNASQDDFYTFHSPPGRKLSASSTGSWQRRTSRTMATKFEFGAQSGNLLSVPTAPTFTSCDSQTYTTSSASSNSTTDSLSSLSVPARRNKLGLALLITVTDSDEMDLMRGCVEHSAQLQALVCRLRAAALAAGAGGAGGRFVATLYKAAQDAAGWLTDLIYGPRLQPTWLNLVTSYRGTNRLAENFLADICTVLAVGDTKHTNFFFSTLLTQVLTHHLGWVTTVCPYDVLDPQKMDPTTAQSRPYNALWAQLNDLCGSIGSPPKAARTIICGTDNEQFVNRILVVLTYFLRCGEIKRRDFGFKNCVPKETKVIEVGKKVRGFKRTSTQVQRLSCMKLDSLPVIRTELSECSGLVTCERTSGSRDMDSKCFSSINDQPMTSQLKRNASVMSSLKSSYCSSVSSDENEQEQRVTFVLGDDEKLVGIKNKSNGGKSVKKSSKIHNEPVDLSECSEKCNRSTESPSKCCEQTLQHSKPIKHSGYKFEFDKYPQIVTNYIKSKNLEILDRHYIGKPGNLKLDNFQFDPTVVPPIQEERCETCHKCQLMESSMLQTPTNASELEFMNDMPRTSEPQFAKETIVTDEENIPNTPPKTFIRETVPNILIVNVKANSNIQITLHEEEVIQDSQETVERKKMDIPVERVIEFPMCALSYVESLAKRSGFDASLLGGVTDHYVPDLILQGTLQKPECFEIELRRELDLTSYLNRSLEAPIQAIAIVADTNTWEVRVCGRGGGGGGGGGAGGGSALVASMLDALAAMRAARVPAAQCLNYLECKLREFCVLSKTFAEMLMSTDFCDIDTLTKSLNIDINDVPLLMAVATTHTPQVARRYGISYR